ncbi:MAG: peptidoglycan-binding protein [Micromonosporaceae bacterium]
MKKIAALNVRLLLPVVLALSAVTYGAAAANAAAVVNMERVVVQAQVEPFRGNQPGIPGDDSVKLVQSALDAKGYSTVVDGWYGTGTRSDYAAWQRSLGYSGIAANGIPGPSSLTRLGSGRFDVQRKILVGAKVYRNGHLVNERTRNMVNAADNRVSWSITLTQGSYRGCSSNSACTHAGGGAVDISVNWSGDSGHNMTSLEWNRAWNTVKALRTVGFAAWLRVPSQCSCNWAYHIHAIAVGDTDTHLQAADQIADYYVGRNGLASHAADNTPSAYRVPFTWYEAFLRGSK